MIAPIVTAALLALLQGPRIQLWTDRGDATVYHRGERVRVYFRADEDAYVTVLRVDTDGRVRVLFPEDPWDDNFARGGQAYEVRPRDVRYAFAIDEYPGQGYVFAIATLDPFDYRSIVLGDHWDYRAIAGGGRVTGDPYVAVQDLVDLMVPANYDAYGYDLATYYVERYYDYPRFLCYDCHSYVAYPYWDPYHYSCIRFRIVVYDDPYYYPARVYAANRVVYRRVARIEPRYVFKDRSATDGYVVRVRQRPVEPAPRRANERGVTGRDLGGVGTVRTPVRDPGARVPERAGVQGLAPTRRLDPVSQPVPRVPDLVPDRRPAGEPAVEARRLPERETPTATDRPRTPGGVTIPAPDRRTPQVVPRPVEPTRGQPQERPKLERREPPSTPVARPEPKVQARPPAAKPAEPVKKPETPQQKKPETPPPRKKPGG
ncbi:MAG: DUF4384 domain-containing protein [Gemmatimonadetes bacterium]|nr:DUF4384 domain-containing protein [Gemmatimonadota bacterium]